MDLNLFRFVVLLFRHRSQSKVCHDLNISRATFNRHLSDCRDWFANELFVVSKGVYTPTLFTEQLIDYVDHPLEQLEQAQQAAILFEGSQWGCEYVFHTVNHLSGLITAPLIDLLTESESDPKLSFVDWALDGVEFPKLGTLSIGVAGYPNTFSDRLIERKVGSLGLFVYMKSSHPLASKDSVELKEIVDSPTVRISMGAFDDNAYYEKIRKSIGFALKQDLTVSSVERALDCVYGGKYLMVCFDVGSELPDSVAKLPLLIGGERMTFDVGIHYHRVNYQHPIVLSIEAKITQALKRHES